MAANAIPFPQPPPAPQPSPQQIQAIQQQIYTEAAKQGLTPQQYVEKLKAHATSQQQAQQGGQIQQQQGQPQQGQPSPEKGQQVLEQQRVPINASGPPKPEALAVAKFLKSQDLKSRTCIFEEKRKELFKVKRALRALQSPAYAKAQSKKNSLLPPVTDRPTAEAAFKLLPMSMLALRVSKITAEDSEKYPHGHPQHVHAPSKAVKGLWNVKVEPQQDTDDAYHYIWVYEGAQWKQKLYAIGALLGVIAVVMYPLWPLALRIGVWYVSMGALGLLAAFFGLGIVRLIIFLITVLAGPQPGIWIYPNLFEDVGFFDSFRPSWAWRETKESLIEKKKVAKEKRVNKKKRMEAKANGSSSPAPAAVASGAEPAAGASSMEKRNLSARVEEADDDE